MKKALLRFNGVARRDPAVEVWLEAQEGVLGEAVRTWFGHMRRCGDEVCELLHDGCPVACLGEVPFGYVNRFRAHVNVGFFQGASLPDPAGLLEGTGRSMRHVKLRAGVAVDSRALGELIEVAYLDIRQRVERGE